MGSGDTGDDSAEILFQSFLQEAVVNSSGIGRGSHSLALSIQYFFSADQGVAHTLPCPERCFEDAVVDRDLAEPCKFPSLRSC